MVHKDYLKNKRAAKVTAFRCNQVQVPTLLSDSRTQPPELTRFSLQWLPHFFQETTYSVGKGVGKTNIAVEIYESGLLLTY